MGTYTNTSRIGYLDILGSGGPRISGHLPVAGAQQGWLQKPLLAASQAGFGPCMPSFKGTMGVLNLSWCSWGSNHLQFSGFYPLIRGSNILNCR